MDKDLMAQYGEACVALEIAQARYNEIKRKVAEAMSKPEKKDDGSV